MSLVTLLIALIIIGVALTLLAMFSIEARLKLLLQVVVIAATLIWLLQHFAGAVRL